VTDQKYINPFQDVHNRVQAFKDRARETQEKDAEIRVQRANDEAVELYDKNE
jgi:hypothetical protein